MINLKNQAGGKVIAIHVGGILSPSNYYELAPSLIITSLQSKKNLYFDIKILEKWKYTTLYRHADAFDKVAIVSDKEQEVAIKKVIETFTVAKGRYFSTSQKEEAWDWVTGEG